jgi:hypothetical protein
METKPMELILESLAGALRFEEFFAAAVAFSLR